MTEPKHTVIKVEPATIRLTVGDVKATAFKPLADGHPCYSLVGLIAAETARIERMVEQSICQLAAIDLRVGASITGQMIGPTPRFNALLQLARNRGMSEAILKRITKTSGHANTHFDRRNRAVHDPWIEDVATGESHQDRGKPKSSPAFGPTPVSDKELKDTLAELRKYRSEVSDLVGDIWVELHST